MSKDASKWYTNVVTRFSHLAEKRAEVKGLLMICNPPTAPS